MIVANATNPRCEIAVIIPAYNAGPCLPRALDSVLAQTYRGYDIYVIDDGSTDDTDAVLRAYADRIISSRQPNAGQASARNHGIRASNSAYVAFLDADDEWTPRKLERQLEVLRRNPRLGMIYSDCSTSGSGPSAGSHFARVGTPASGRIFEKFLANCNVFTPTVVVRRECLDDVGLFNESLAVGEDFNLWLRIAARWEVAVIPEVLAIRHPTPNSLSQVTSADLALRSSIALFEDVMQACPHLSAPEREALRKTIADRHYLYGTFLLQRGHRAASRYQMLEAMRCGRFDWRAPAKVALSFLPLWILANRLPGWSPEIQRERTEV